MEIEKQDGNGETRWKWRNKMEMTEITASGQDIGGDGQKAVVCIPDPSGRARTKVGNILMSAEWWSCLVKPLFISWCRRFITRRYMGVLSFKPFTNISICQERK